MIIIIITKKWEFIEFFKEIQNHLSKYTASILNCQGWVASEKDLKPKIWTISIYFSILQRIIWRMIYTTFTIKSIGDFKAYKDNGKLIKLTLPPSVNDVSNEKNNHIKKVSNSEFKDEIRQIDEYFKKKRRKFNLDISLIGTDFQKKVWNALAEIPYGETFSYKWIADKIGRPKSSRAVGGACGKNPLPLIIPCHRVIASNGSLCGFGSGIDFKKFLLELEGVII